MPEPVIRPVLECVSKRKIRKFEWILRQFKEETRRLSSAKSRIDDAEMAQKTPKLRIREFLRHTLIKYKMASRRGIYRSALTCIMGKQHLQRTESRTSGLAVP